MIKHICSVKHNPPHSYGDCLRASIASLLDIERAEDVPHFADNNADTYEIMHGMRSYLAQYGLRPVYFSLPPEMTFAEITNFMHAQNRGVYYLLFGATEHGGDHVVICLNNRKVHDTAWYPQPLVKPASFGLWTVCMFASMRMVNDTAKT